MAPARMVPLNEATVKAMRHRGMLASAGERCCAVPPNATRSARYTDAGTFVVHAHAPAPLHDTPEAYLRALGRVTARLVAGADRGDLSQIIADSVAETFAATLVQVWLYDRTDGSLSLSAAAGRDVDPAAGHAPVPVSGPLALASRAIERRAPVIDAIGTAGSGGAEGEGACTGAGFPLIRGDRAAGALVVLRGRIPPALVEALGILAQQAALALEHARLLHEPRGQDARPEVRGRDPALPPARSGFRTPDGGEATIATRQRERLTTLAEITKRLLGVSDLATVLHVVAEAAVRLCGAAGAVVAITDAARRRLVPAAHHGTLQAWFDSFTEANLDEAFRADTPTARALRTGEAVLLADYAAGPVLRPSQAATIAAGVRAFIAAPLRKGRESLGMLWVADTTPGSLTTEDAALVKALADQAALAIDQARLVEESHTLQVIAAELASTRDTHALMEGIVERTMAAFGADACAVWLVDAESGRLKAGAAQGLPARFFETVYHRLDETRASSGAAFAEMRRTRRPLYTRDDQARARSSEDVLTQALAEEGVVSALRLPLFEPGGSVTGMLALYHRRERIYSDSEVRLAQAFTDQIAVALHNARLAEKERDAQAAAKKRLERLQAVVQITEQLLATTDLDAVLEVIVEAASRLCGASGAMIGLADESRQTVSRVATHGSIAFFQEAPPIDLDAADHTATGHVFATGKTVVVDDYATWPMTTTAQRRAVETGLRAVVVAPIRVAGEVIGVLWVGDTAPRVFAPDDVTLVEALADQTALAIEHVRLVRRSQDAAVLEERTRLAQELHDSVTQSVFSLGMLARAAKTQHERGAATLSGTLDRIGRLAEESLREMRALLFELQPSGLADEGLATALEKLVAAARVRFDLAATYNLDASHTAQAAAPVRLRADVETAIFRIAQEALTNAAKHARAGAVIVTLTCDETALRVTVADDGVGFDPEANDREPGAGGFGMRTMRERAAAAGVTLRIESAPGAGTRVMVEAPLPAKTNEER